MAAATARVRVFSDGRALVETAGHEIGNGLYTVVAQTASERLGIPVEKVSVALGDTDLPPAPVAGGSISTASVCTVVAEACELHPQASRARRQAGRRCRRGDERPRHGGA